MNKHFFQFFSSLCMSFFLASALSAGTNQSKETKQKPAAVSFASVSRSLSFELTQINVTHNEGDEAGTNPHTPSPRADTYSPLKEPAVHTPTRNPNTAETLIKLLRRQTTSDLSTHYIELLLAEVPSLEEFWYSVDQYGNSPLHIAIATRKQQAALCLIKHGAPCDAVNAPQQTPLMFASRCGSTDIIKVLLEKGVDINAQDGTGETALMKAVAARQKNAVSMLMIYGADTTLRNCNDFDAAKKARHMHKNLQPEYDELQTLKKSGNHTPENTARLAELKKERKTLKTLSELLAAAGINPEDSVKQRLIITPVKGKNNEI